MRYFSAFVFVLIACRGPHESSRELAITEEDGGAGSGSGSDASTGSDAGMGSGSDAGAIPDADAGGGMGSDAGATVDADAGAGMGSDAGMPVDAAVTVTGDAGLEESVYTAPETVTSVPHPGGLDVALAGTSPTWYGGVLVDPTGATRAIDSQLAMTTFEPFDRARNLYEQYGIFVPSWNEAHATWLHDRVDPMKTCTAYCYLVVEPLNAPNALSEQTAPNSACSHPDDNDWTRDSKLQQGPRPDYSWDMWTCKNSNESNYRANVSLRCDYSKGCANNVVGCSFKFHQTIKGSLYAWAWRRYNVKGDPAKLSHFPYEARALAKLEATLYGPLAANTWQKQEIATEVVAHSKTEPTDADKTKDESPLAAIWDIKVEYEPDKDPMFKVSGLSVATAVYKVAAAYYKRWRAEEKGSIDNKEDVVESGFRDAAFTMAPPQPAATFTLSLGQIRLKTSRNAKVDSFMDDTRDHNGRALARAWAFITTQITEPKVNPEPFPDAVPTKKCVLSFSGEGSEFTVSSGVKRSYTQAEMDSANTHCSIWAIDQVRTNRAQTCVKRTMNDTCGGRYFVLSNKPDLSPVIPPSDLCVNYCLSWVDACCWGDPKPDACK